MSYYVYVLKSEHHKKSYVGHTDNLARRLKEHNEGKANYSRRYRPWKIIYTEKYNSLNEAIIKEKYYKNHSGRKELKRIFNNCGIV